MMTIVERASTLRIRPAPRLASASPVTHHGSRVRGFGYDIANRLETLAHVKTPTTIESLTYQNDSAGNRTKLTRANAAATLLPAALTQTEYDAANEQIRFNSATTNLIYDNNGNLTSFTDASGTTTYTWNARNQMTAISGPSLTASFAYDGLGRRTSKTVNSATTGFWYDGNDVRAELSGSSVTASYVRSLTIDEPFIRKGASDEFYQRDALGSTLVLSDATGTAQTTYTYEPFGKTTMSGASTNSFQYTERENDGTGLYYYHARYYHSGLQRFLSEDPIGLAGGFNFYAYVQNNPTNNIDPLGLCVVGFTILPGTQDGIIIASTNDGSSSVGPFIATNRAGGNGPIPPGTYQLGNVRRYGHNGTPTPYGLQNFDHVNGRPRNRQQAFGDAFIEVNNVPGRTGIGIHAMYPEPPVLPTPDKLKKTIGCIRTRNADINEIANFLDQNCRNESNYFIKHIKK